MDESRASNLRDFSALSGELAPGADSLANLDGNGEPLFVINLCAAMTPIDLSSQALAGLSQYKLYQVSRMEDGRRRYRLRLGFFTTEADAENVLSSIRARYATAFTSCLCEEDLKHATGYMKCSVKDLERTGRYAVLKVRGDSGATTTIRALDPALMQAKINETTAIRPVVIHPVISEQPLQKPIAPKATVSPIRATPNGRVNEPSKLAPSLIEDLVIETSWQPAPQATHKTPPNKPAVTAPPHAAPKAAAPTNNAAAPAQTQIQNQPPKRTSLMQQAHAMAPMDAVERAKAIPGNSASAFVDTLATGKFKLPPITAPTQIQPAPTRSAPAQVQQPTAPLAATKAAPPKPVIPAPAATKPAPAIAPRIAPNYGANPLANSGAKISTNTASITPSIKLEARTPPLHTTTATIQKANQAFHVGAGVNIPDTMLSLAPSQPPVAPATHAQTAAQTSYQILAKTPAAATTTSMSGTPVSRVVSPTVETSSTDDLLRARALAKQSVQWRQDNGEIPTLDTTQTIRTLTKNELEDANRPKWFTVQLAISDHPANLDTMPKLDIFDAYSLYSVAVMEGTGIRHALRLGFFREEVSAMAVMGYLKTFFNEPIITRIPDAEHDRFVDAPKLSALSKPSANNVMLDEKHAAKHSPVTNMTNTVPTISAAVERTASMTKHSPPKPMAKSAPPATKRAPMTTPGKKSAPAKGAGSKGQHDMLDEASLLGLTDTQILRVRKNPSLLSRLLGK